MSKIRAIFRYLSAFILGVSIACFISPAAADITQQVARYMADTVTFRADSGVLSFSRVLAIKALTADGSDNGNLCFSGGGNTGSQGRGSYVCSNGNESSNGALQIAEGSNGGGVAITSGTTTTTGTFTSSRATDFGWAIVDQTDNQACTTGCTSAAVFGINLAAGATAPVIVGPSDATADVCLCAGAS